MQQLTPEGSQAVAQLAQKYGVSQEAVRVLLDAVNAGYGTQAQFSHPDLGGMGQWSQGGMIMIGDMFNQGLKYKVSGLCDEISGLLRAQPIYAPAPVQSQSQMQGSGGVSFFVQGSGSGSWWPAELGAPSSSGSQNDLSYAFFPTTRRLAIRQGGATHVYDTGDHYINGVSQQQSGDQSFTFTSQYGLVRVADLPLVSPLAGEPPASFATPAAVPPPPPPPPAATFAAPPPPPPAAPAATSAPASTDDIFNLLERLADLRQKQIISEEEFAAKKAELLGRL